MTINFNLIAGIIALAASAIAYVFHLRSEVEKHQNTIATLQTQLQSKEFQEQIAQSIKNVQETVHDFETAKSDFITKYGNGGGDSTDPNSNSGSGSNS